MVKFYQIATIYMLTLISSIYSLDHRDREVARMFLHLPKVSCNRSSSFGYVVNEEPASEEDFLIANDICDARRAACKEYILSSIGCNQKASRKNP